MSTIRVHTLVTPSHDQVASNFMLPSAEQDPGLSLIVHRARQRGTGNLGDEGWHEALRDKAQLMLEISESENDLWVWCDADVFFLKPVSSTLSGLLGEHDLAIMPDVEDQVDSGFFISRSNEQTRKFFRLILDGFNSGGVCADSETGDQAGFNAFRDKLNTRILPKEHFMSTGRLSPEARTFTEQGGTPDRFLDEVKDASVFHANHLSSRILKRDTLRALGDHLNVNPLKFPPREPRDILITGCSRSGTTMMINLFDAAFPELVVETVECRPGYYVRPTGAGRVAIKHPMGTRFVLSEALNTYHVINLFRDGRDVICSHHKAVGSRFYTDKSRWVKAVEDVLAENNHPHLTNIRYEDFVSDPDNELKKLADTLGLTPPQLPENWWEGRQLQDGSTPRPVDSKSVGNWKKYPHRVLFLGKRFKSLLRELGYR